MAWFATADPSTEMDSQIETATSESIPNGDLDMAVALEITDAIRSKKVPPKTAMRCLKKRLAKVYTNPNLLSSTIKLCDMCVKNGGSAFIDELNSKEFVDYLVEFIFKVHYDTKHYQVYSSEAKYAVGMQILKILREWSMYFEQKSHSYLHRVYAAMEKQGYEFPAVDASVAQNASNFVDSVTPPDWVDGKECMICYNPFSVMNRKHHCRACGGVFCQMHSGHSLPLPSLGIVLPVRVCDDCYSIHKRDDEARVEPRGAPTPRAIDDDDDDELKKAIELSLKDSGPSYAAPAFPPPDFNADSDLDDDMKMAIAASLADAPKQPQSKPESEPEPEPESEFYQTAITFDADAYAEPNAQKANAYNAPNSNGYASSQHALPSTLPKDSNDQSNQAQPFSTGYRNSHPVSGQSTGQSRTSPSQDLTQQEEDDINLFVQLINGVKSDPHRRANILNDQNLSDLHSRVVRLRPRLNRSLRESIEKYDFFLEMNNKINTVTRLYDEFLENKLSQAYGRHSVHTPHGNQEMQYRDVHLTSQDTAMGTRHSGVFPPPPEFAAQGTAQGHVGYQAHATTGPTAPYPLDVENSYKEAYNPTYKLGEKFEDYSQLPDNPSSKPSKFEYPKEPSEQYSARDYPASNKEQLQASQITYPQAPSSPPGSDVSDAESVASRYPALEEQFEETEAPHTGHASERFPAMSEIEKQSSRKTEPEPLIEL